MEFCEQEGQALGLVHCFYINQTNILSCPIPVTSSQCAKKILSIGQIVRDFGDWGVFLNPKKEFSISKAYEVLLGDHPLISQKSLLKYNKTCPKAIFILWMSLHGRLNMAERISRWNPTFEMHYKLCNSFVDSQAYIFL